MSVTLPSAFRARERELFDRYPLRLQLAPLHLLVNCQFLGEFVVETAVPDAREEPVQEADHVNLVRSGFEHAWVAPRTRRMGMSTGAGQQVRRQPPRHQFVSPIVCRWESSPQGRRVSSARQERHKAPSDRSVIGHTSFRSFSVVGCRASTRVCSNLLGHGTTAVDRPELVGIRGVERRRQLFAQACR